MVPIPTFIDDENNPITLTYQPMLAFMTLLSNNTFSFSPTKFSQVGEYIINVTISDGQPLINWKIFNGSVINLPPVWADSNAKL